MSNPAATCPSRSLPHAALPGELPGTRADALIYEGGDLVAQVRLRGLLVKIGSNGWTVRLTCASITVAAFVTGFGLLAAYLGAPVWGSLLACGVGRAKCSAAHPL